MPTVFIVIIEYLVNCDVELYAVVQFFFFFFFQRPIEAVECLDSHWILPGWIVCSQSHSGKLILATFWKNYEIYSAHIPILTHTKKSTVPLKGNHYKSYIGWWGNKYDFSFQFLCGTLRLIFKRVISPRDYRGGQEAPFLSCNSNLILT